MKRILLKLSGESLMGEKATALMRNVLLIMPHKYKTLHKKVYKLVSLLVEATSSADSAALKKVLTASKATRWVC